MFCWSSGSLVFKALHWVCTDKTNEDGVEKYNKIVLESGNKKKTKKTSGYTPPGRFFCTSMSNLLFIFFFQPISYLITQVSLNWTTRAILYKLKKNNKLRHSTDPVPRNRTDTRPLNKWKIGFGIVIYGLNFLNYRFHHYKYTLFFIILIILHLQCKRFSVKIQLVQKSACILWERLSKFIHSVM